MATITVISYRAFVEGGNPWTADPTDIIQSFQHVTSRFYISQIDIYMWGLSPYGVSGVICSTYLADASGKPTGGAIDTAWDVSSIVSTPRHVDMRFVGSNIVYEKATRYCFVLHYDTVVPGVPYENDSVSEFYYINDVQQTNILSLYVRGNLVADPPGKAQNPTPTDDQEDIIITGIEKLKKLQWEAPA